MIKTSETFARGIAARIDALRFAVHDGPTTFAARKAQAEAYAAAGRVLAPGALPRLADVRKDTIADWLAHADNALTVAQPDAARFTTALPLVASRIVVGGRASTSKRSAPTRPTPAPVRAIPAPPPVVAPLPTDDDAPDARRETPREALAGLLRVCMADVPRTWLPHDADTQARQAAYGEAFRLALGHGFHLPTPCALDPHSLREWARVAVEEITRQAHTSHVAHSDPAPEEPETHAAEAVTRLDSAEAFRAHVTSGNALVRLTSAKTGASFLFRIRKADGRGPAGYFVGHVRHGGRDGYTYLGYIARDGVTWKSGHADDPAQQAWAWAWSRSAAGTIPPALRIEAA